MRRVICFKILVFFIFLLFFIKYVSADSIYRFSTSPDIISNRQEGSIFAWIVYDSESSLNALYAQSIGFDGVLKPSFPLFITNEGNLLRSSAFQSPTVASDQQGGAFVAWVDYTDLRNPISYLRSVDSSGNLNLPIIQIDGEFQKIYPDNNGNVFVLFQENERRGPAPPEIITKLYTQSFASNGNPLTDKIEIDRNSVWVVRDGTDGEAVVFWEERELYHIAFVNRDGIRKILDISKINGRILLDVISNEEGKAVVLWGEQAFPGDTTGTFSRYLVQFISSDGELESNEPTEFVSLVDLPQGFYLVGLDGVLDSEGGLVATFLALNPTENSYKVFARFIYPDHTVDAPLYDIYSSLSQLPFLRIIGDGNGGGIIIFKEYTLGEPIHILAKFISEPKKENSLL